MRFVRWLSRLALMVVAMGPVGKARLAIAQTQQPEITQQTAAEPAWQVDLYQRRAQLIAQNGPGTNAELRSQLLALREADQSARGLSRGQPTHDGKLQMASNLREIDAHLTAQLKTIVAEDGWPTIAIVGMEASNGAMLVLTHTQDHAWQRSLLPQLEALADAGKVDGSYVATLVDKALVSEGKLQRYGTQFKAVDGELAMFGVEDPGELDARRAKVFLPPMDVYRQQLAQMYHLKASNMIVMAPAPAQ